MKHKLQRLLDYLKNVFLFVGNMDPIVQRNLVNRMCEEHSGICGAFTGSDEEGKYRYIIASRTRDAREVKKIRLWER